MDSSMLQINAPASIQCLPVHAASTATNDLYKEETPLSVFVTQSDVHSMHLSPVPLSLPRPSLQAMKSTRRRDINNGALRVIAAYLSCASRW